MKLKLPSSLFYWKLYSNCRVLSGSRKLSSKISSSTSYLYPPRYGDTKIMTIVKPYLDGLLDHEHSLQRLENNLRSRGLPKLDLGALSKALTEIKSIGKQIGAIKKERELNTALYAEKLNEGVPKTAAEHVMQEGKELRSKFKRLTLTLNELEDFAVPLVLQLPCELHSDTPLDRPRVAFVHGNSPGPFKFPCLDHIELGRRTRTLQFDDDVGAPGTYYLTGQTAAMELASQDFLASRLTKHGFSQFSNPDFCKPVISEGCGQMEDEPRTVRLVPEIPDTPGYHLPGSTSLPAFCAYHTKQSVHARHLPLRYFASGRSYRAPSTHFLDLFGGETTQTTGTHFFAVAGNTEGEDALFQDCVSVLRDTFMSLDLHFRVLDVAAGDLHQSESRRTEVQLWSPAAARYSTVANVSSCGSFLGRRLWMLWHSGSAKWNFLHAVHGSALSFPVLLAAIMENTQTADGDFKIPEELERFMAEVNVMA